MLLAVIKELFSLIWGKLPVSKIYRKLASVKLTKTCKNFDFYMFLEQTFPQTEFYAFWRGKCQRIGSIKFPGTKQETLSGLSKAT